MRALRRIWCPVPKYEDDYDIIDGIESRKGVDAAVNHDVPFGVDGEVHHTAEFLYVPSTSDDQNGKYAVFATNRDHVTPDEINQITGRYRRRWDIENQYKSMKDFLPKTSSKDYRVRLVKFALTALIYNLWRLTDYFIKNAVGIPFLHEDDGRMVRTPPELTAKTFIRALGDFLREFD